MVLCLVLSLMGCIRKPPADIPDSQKELDHLIILEVFYIGSPAERKLGKKVFYYLDESNPYIKIYNPTNEVKYLDGLAIASSYFYSTTYISFDIPEQNFIPERSAVNFVLHFPGDGKDYPILPGETKLLVNAAINHLEDRNWDPEYDVYMSPANPNSLDLSVADFEWYTSHEDFKNAGVGLTDNPDVPNLQKTFMDGRERFPYFRVLHNKTLMLINMPKEEFEDGKRQNHYRTYEHTIIATDTPNKEKETVMTIPNQYIIDAVTLCPTGSYAFGPVHESVDAGWAGVTESHLGKNITRSKYTRSLLNNAIRWHHDGRRFVDTNNSMMDFQVVPASNIKDYSKVKQSLDEENTESI